MPTTSNRDLTLITEGKNTTIKVTYKAIFSPFERHLAANGLKFVERIRVIGVDPPGAVTGTTLHQFTPNTLPVTAGTTKQIINRERSMTVTRASLQEDTGLGDDDEIRCRIDIDMIGMPTDITAYTDQEVLLG
jgi:hypothetical protein